jgi:hypothetical protein
MMWKKCHLPGCGRGEDSPIHGGSALRCTKRCEEGKGHGYITDGHGIDFSKHVRHHDFRGESVLPGIVYDE